MPLSGRFDFDLSDRLTELDLELAEKFQACPCDCLQIPDARSIEELAESDMITLIYAEQTES